MPKVNAKLIKRIESLVLEIVLLALLCLLSKHMFLIDNKNLSVILLHLFKSIKKNCWNKYDIFGIEFTQCKHYAIELKNSKHELIVRGVVILKVIIPGAVNTTSNDIIKIYLDIVCHILASFGN